MRVLVTGGAGFIGSHVVERLVEEGFKVTVLDDLSTGSLENLEQVSDEVEFVRGDVRDPEAVARALRGVELVVHEAAIVSVEESIRDPLRVNSVNVDGTLNLLEACHRAGVKRLVYASSASVYGDDPTLPKREDMEPRPKSPYAASKHAGELLCLAYTELGRLEAVVLRYFNVYGPRQRGGPYGGAMSSFISRALRGEPPVIYGDGGQTRDFVYVGDVAEATVRALLSERAVGQVVNVATGRPVSLNELARMVVEAVGVDLEPIHAEPRPGDVRHSYADISRARSLLGWEPRVSLEEGVRETVEWFRARVETRHAFH